VGRHAKCVQERGKADAPNTRQGKHETRQTRAGTGGREAEEDDEEEKMMKMMRYMQNRFTNIV